MERWQPLQYNVIVTIVKSFKNFSPRYFNMKWQGQFQLKDIPSSFLFSKRKLCLAFFLNYIKDLNSHFDEKKKDVSWDVLEGLWLLRSEADSLQKIQTKYIKGKWKIENEASSSGFNMLHPRLSAIFIAHGLTVDASIQQMCTIVDCFNITLSSQVLIAIRQQKMQSGAAKLQSISLANYFLKIILERNRKDKEWGGKQVMAYGN